MARALAIFHGENESWYAGLLKPGYRHCFSAVVHGGVWVIVDARADGCHVSATDAAFDLATFYRDHGFTVIERELGEPERRIEFPLFTCVESVKRTLYVRCRAVTPWQLYRALRNGSIG